jgi:hypothetical protein
MQERQLQPQLARQKIDQGEADESRYSGETSTRHWATLPVHSGIPTVRGQHGISRFVACHFLGNVDIDVEHVTGVRRFVRNTEAIPSSMLISRNEKEGNDAN